MAENVKAIKNKKLATQKDNQSKKRKELDLEDLESGLKKIVEIDRKIS